MNGANLTHASPPISQRQQRRPHGAAQASRTYSGGGTSPTRWLLVAMLFVIVFRLHELAPAASSILRPGFLAGPVGLSLMYFNARHADRSYLVQDGMLRAVAMFLGWAVLTVPTSLYKSLAIESAQALLPLLLVVAAFALASPTEKMLEFVLNAFVGLGGLLALAALAVGDMSTGRLQVTMTLDPNDLGAMMAFIFPLALGRLSKRYLFRSVVAIIIAAMSVVVLLRTGSRGSTLGLMTGAIFFAMFQAGRARTLWLVVLAISASIGWQFAPATFKERMTTLTNVENDYNTTVYGGRKQIWERGISYAVANPILGVGVGNFPIAEGNRMTEQGMRGKWSPAHNAYVQAAAETGFVGAALFIALLVLGFRYSLVWCSVPFSRTRKDHDARPEMFAALAGFSVAAFFLSMTYFWALFALFGLIALARRVRFATSTPFPRAPTARPSRREINVAHSA
jgi:O-antigen ligase